jgi:hypothetical protein
MALLDHESDPFRLEIADCNLRLLPDPSIPHHFSLVKMDDLRKVLRLETYDNKTPWQGPSHFCRITTMSTGSAKANPANDSKPGV